MKKSTKCFIGSAVALTLGPLGGSVFTYLSPLFSAETIKMYEWFFVFTFALLHTIVGAVLFTSGVTAYISGK